MCCSVLQRVAVCKTHEDIRESGMYMLWCVAGCCSMLQCVAVCCSVLQCVADIRNTDKYQQVSCKFIYTYANSYIHMHSSSGMKFLTHAARSCILSCRAHIYVNIHIYVHT